MKAGTFVFLVGFSSSVLAFIYIYLRMFVDYGRNRGDDSYDSSIISRLGAADFGEAGFPEHVLTFIALALGGAFALIFFSRSRESAPPGRRHQQAWLQAVIDDAHREEVVYGFTMLLVVLCGDAIIAHTFYIVQGGLSDGGVIVSLLLFLVYVGAAGALVAIGGGSNGGLKYYVYSLQRLVRMECYAAELPKSFGVMKAESEGLRRRAYLEGCSRRLLLRLTGLASWKDAPWVTLYIILCVFPSVVLGVSCGAPHRVTAAAACFVAGGGVVAGAFVRRWLYELILARRADGVRVFSVSVAVIGPPALFLSGSWRLFLLLCSCSVPAGKYRRPALSCGCAAALLRGRSCVSSRWWVY